MWLFSVLHVGLLLVVTRVQGTAPLCNSNPIVRASTGIFTGRINSNYSDVREFLNVPYGVSTAGENRFMPPQAVPLSSQAFDATNYAPACPQYVSSSKTIWNQEIPQFLQYWGTPNNSAGESAKFASEDCLKLAIWTPANASASARLPVLMFWTGGGYQSNGILVPGQLPGRWVHRSQSHIVVTINYRLNILGFPNAASLSMQNLGLLDQRLALEWVRDNIVYFGGDPSRLTIWGQSAGASSVDIHNYAFYNDPIAHGFFAQSGNVFASFALHSDDPDHQSFSLVAKGLGCDFPTDAQQELQCMQRLPYDDIINYMGRYSDAGTKPGIKFSPVPDEKIVFSNYPERYLQQRVTRAPMIYSTAANEGVSLTTFPADDPQRGVNQTAANQVTEGILCGAAKSSVLRESMGLPTYRYQYAGNWTNQDPLPWMGAYHSSDLVMLFGTYADGVGPAVPLEVETSEVMEDLVLAFVKDPWNGLSASQWPRFKATASNGGTMLRFGANQKASQEVNGNDVQGVCFGKGEYNPFP